jgi:hypothetical protein
MLYLYANGGGLNTTDSTLQQWNQRGLTPISENAEVDKTLTKKTNRWFLWCYFIWNGEPVANVEDKEVVVDGNLVHWDTLKKGGKLCWISFRS